MILIDWVQPGLRKKSHVLSVLLAIDAKAVRNDSWAGR